MKEDQIMTTVKNTEVLYQNFNSVAPLGLICMNGTQELGAKINSYLERWADRNGMEHDDYMIECQCPRFQSGDAKGLIKSTVRGKDLFILVDVGNYSCKYKLFDQENSMSPDDHYMDLMRIIQAASGKPHRINVIMPLLYGGRQHRRSYRESLDCAVALQEMQRMGVQNVVTVDAHDPRVCNAVPLMGFDNVMPSYQVLKAMFKDFPDRVFAVRRESPLIVGVAEGECFIASDVPAILQYTRNYYLLDHDEIVTLSSDGVSFVDEHLDPIEKELQTADWDMEAAEKGGYPHFMIKEINEQPEAIRTTIMPRIKEGLPFLEECGITTETIKNFKNITIVACGTAMHAGMVGKYVIEDLARVPVNVDIASEFRYRNPIVGEGDLVIIISQSGETADSLAAMRLAKQKGAKTLAIVNAKGSSIAREADMLIYTLAGPEISVPSTKAYITQLSVMYLFAFELALAKETISTAECKRLVSALTKMPEAVQYVIDNCEDTCKFVATKLVATDSLLYIGRGLDYALSMEGSLKLKEVSYIHSESYAAGELKHGTISLVDEDVPVIAVATQTDIIPKTISNVVEVKSRGAKVILVCTDACARELKDGVADYVIEIPHTDELLMPITAVVPLQILAYYTSINRGIDPDKPKNLAKSVTVE